MLEHFPLMIPGAAPEGAPLTVVAPYDRTPLATVEQAGPAAVERALATASALFRNRDAWLPPLRRLEILDQVAALVAARRETLAIDAAREGGKPLVDSMVEVDRTINSLRLCAMHLRTQAGTEIPMNLNAASAGRMALTRFEPIGVVVAFSAFNHPLNLIAHQVGPAIAAGCPVIIKPAEAAPLSCFRLVGLLREAGLPAEWCQPLLTTDHDVAGQLASDSRVAYFSFIGNGRVGWMLRSRLAPGARCGLEHGGAAPVVVADDADLDLATPLLTKGGFYHAGQVCVSVQRVFAGARGAGPLAERIATAARLLKVGDPTQPDTDVGPLIRPSEVTRVHEWVTAAIAGGAQLICGGQPLSPTCYPATVLLDPPADAKVSTQEIFGPVVCVYTTANLDDAIARANALPFAFQSAVFTRQLDTALRCAQRLDAAAVMINDHTAFRVDWMPFAGLRESGLGVGGIPYTMSEMQAEKLIVIRSPELL